MVKKKVKKTKVVKPKVKKVRQKVKEIKKRIKPIKKSHTQVKKDLEIFTKGVERLKELENELNSLDTRGFYREEQLIRIKLKNVSDIPIIERLIKNLRLKINKKYKKTTKKKSPYEKIVGDITEVMEGVPKIQKHFEKLNKKMNKITGKEEKSKIKIDKSLEFKCPKCGDVVSLKSSVVGKNGKRICSACKIIEDF